MDQVEVGGLRIAYERAGTGPPVALAHGFVGDGVSTWSKQIDALSRDFTVIAWDAPGAGHSADPPESFRAADYADCWAAFLGELGFTHAHLVGLSFGGIVALSLFERRPDLPSSLALVSAYAGWRGSLSEADVDAGCAAACRCPARRTSSPARCCPRCSRLLPPSPSWRPSRPASVRSAQLSGPMAKASPRPTCGRASGGHGPTLLLYGDQDERAATCGGGPPGGSRPPGSSYSQTWGMPARSRLVWC